MITPLKDIELYELFKSLPGAWSRLQRKTARMKKNGYTKVYLRCVLNPDDPRTNFKIIKKAEELSLTLLEEKKQEKEAQAARRVKIASDIQDLQQPQTQENAA